jgi:TonB family protein
MPVKNTARNLPSEQVTTIAPAPSGAGAEILAVTEDDFFLLAVRRVVTLPNRVWHATSDAQAADMLMSTPCAVVLLDIALVPQLEQVVTRLRQQLPELGFVIAGEPEDEAQVTDLIDNGDVQGFVVKAHATTRLAKLLESGINRHFELKTETVAVAAKPAWKNPIALGGLAAVLLAIAGGATWYFTRGDSAAQPAAGDADLAVTGTDSSQLATTEKLDTELARAREAFEAGRYVDAKGAAAFDHYKAALAIDANNAEARDGVHRIAEVMLARAEASLLESKAREAAASIKVAKAVEPNHPRIAFLESQVTRELDRSAAAQQEAAKADALNQKLAGLIKLGNERLAQERFVDPANDSARYYFIQAREVDSGSVLVQQSLRALATRMVAKSQQLATRGDDDAAGQLLAQAKQLNVSGIDFGRAEKDMKASAQRGKTSEADRILGLARARINDGQLIDPENDSARFYVAQMRQQFPDNAGLGPVVESLRGQLVAQASAAAERSDVRTGQRLLDEAKNLGASGASFDQASAALSVAKRKIDSMAAPIAVRDNMVVKSVTPDYPTRAQRKHQEGYVDLHFTSSTTGEVKDIVVAASEPQGVFDEAAIRALRRWKFKPKEVDGQPTDQRLALRMRFELAE